MRSWVRDNGLSVALFACFFAFIVGQLITGSVEFNKEQEEHKRRPLNYVQYATSGHFIEATFENWESEFLQMAAYIVFTAMLFQRGSSESKDPDEKSVEKADSKLPTKFDIPWPVRKGGLTLKLYQNSLSIAFVLMFLLASSLHALGGSKLYNLELKEKGEPQISPLEYVGTSRFWFESFQNWQSEFFSMALMVVLSVYLRQKGSPESKDVDAPDSQTGSK